MTGAARFWDGLQQGHDRSVMASAAALLVAGVVLALAAGPGAAAQLDLASSFQLAMRHAGYAALAGLVLLATGQFNPRDVRRFALGALAVSLFALICVAFIGVEKKGAQRWLDLAGFSVQPSEFAKPAVVVVCAWMLASRLQSPRFPGVAMVAVVFGGFAALVAPQPDLGQTVLTGVVVLALLALARVDMRIVLASLVMLAVIAIAAYGLFDHVRGRIDGFFAQEVAANSQVGMALRAVGAGGAMGVGLGEGQVKLNLPDAHADFIFAVAAEELGLLGAFGLIGLHACLAWCGLSRAATLRDDFARLAATGLFLLLGLQALTHIAVNVALAPAKGMTLPFVSYGGSSLLASALALGWALALIRTRPDGLQIDRKKGTQFA